MFCLTFMSEAIFLLNAKKYIVCVEKKHDDVSIVNIKMTGTKRCLKRKQRETRAGFYYDRQINNNGNHYWVSSLMMRAIRDTNIILTRSERGQKIVSFGTLLYSFGFIKIIKRQA